jgi:tetratricopeptide (TPR) repeat protein
MEILRERWPALIVALFLLLGLNPSPIAAPLVDSLHAARVALQAGRPEPALANIEAAMTYEPALESLHWLAAQLALSTGDAELALSHLDQLQPTSKLEFEQVCLRSRVHLALDNYERALRIRETLDEDCPDEVEFLQTLAKRQLQSDEFEQARTSLESWTLLEPSAAAPRLQLGLVTAVLQPDQALTHLRLAEEFAPQSAPLARSLIQTIEDAQTFNDETYTLAQVGQTMVRAGKWSLAAQAFKKALELNPNYTEVQAYLGLSLDKLGEEGVDHLSKAVQDAPEAALPRVFLALHWIDRGEFSLAKAQLEEAAALDPKNPAIAAELGAAYSALGDLQAAEAAYRRATSLAPEQADFWQLLAQFSLGREMELETLAIPAARNAAILGHAQASALDALGYAHLLADQPIIAERLLLQAYQMEPTRPQTLFHLGQLRLMQGHEEQARQSLQLAVALDPHGAIGQTAQRILDGLRP